MNKTLTDQQLPDTAGMPFLLSEAAKGQKVRLVRIDAGKKLTHRLNELGLTPGVEVLLVQASGGPLLLCVRDSRVAIGRGMAEKLTVTAMN